MKPALPTIVKVSAAGIDADGNDVTLHAAADQVRLGHMVNVPVLAQYPNGEIRSGNVVMITPKGLEFLKREVPVDMRKPGGSA